MTSNDGVHWSDKRILSETADDKCAPALTFAQEKLFLAWTGRDHDHSLNVTSFAIEDDGTLAEFGKVVLDEKSASDAGPALTTVNDRVILVWQGTDHHLNITSSSDNGLTWSNKVTLDEKSTNIGVAGLAFGNGTLFLDWSGHESHHRLNVMAFKVEADGSLSAGEKVVLEEQSYR
jgi:hypothetical protein